MESTESPTTQLLLVQPHELRRARASLCLCVPLDGRQQCFVLCVTAIAPQTILYFWQEKMKATSSVETRNDADDVFVSFGSSTCALYDRTNLQRRAFLTSCTCASVFGRLACSSLSQTRRFFVTFTRSKAASLSIVPVNSPFNAMPRVW